MVRRLLLLLCLIDASDGMRSLRRQCFLRLVPNLREIGLLTPRVLPRYQDAGLAEYVGGRSARELAADEIVDALD